MSSYLLDTTLVQKKDKLLPWECLEYVTDSDGSFVFESVPPAEYYLLATDDADLEYSSPEMLKRLAPRVKLINVVPHATVEETLSLIEP